MTKRMYSFGFLLFITLSIVALSHDMALAVPNYYCTHDSIIGDGYRQYNLELPDAIDTVKVLPVFVKWLWMIDGKPCNDDIEYGWEYLPPSLELPAYAEKLFLPVSMFA